MMEGGEVKEVWAEGTFEGEDEKVVGDEGMVEGTRGTGREGGTVDEHGMVAQLGEIEMGDEEVEEVQQEGAVEAGSGVGGKDKAVEELRKATREDEVRLEVRVVGGGEDE